MKRLPNPRSQMGKKSVANSKNSNLAMFEERRPTLSAPEGSVSVLSNARNTHISDSSFIINTTHVSAGAALNILYNRVAPNAILNSGGRADEVRCHPGTREEVIGRIDKWRLDIEDGVIANQMFWLSGPAGAGKTAIVQTVAETWKARGIHTANFFFFRTDPTRSHPGALVSTLLYQIFDFCPAAREAIDKALSLKPRILEAGLEEQVEALICTTFRAINPSFSQPIVLLIDGLDECDSDEKASQRQILRALDKIVGQTDIRFLVLVASRAELHISAAFNGLTSKVESIFLDGRYLPATDIRRFVTAEFETIKRLHPHAALLENTWPSDRDIEEIVEKSSGQFIYAATVMRFITDSSAVPSLSLERVQGIVPPSKNSPFTHLDAFYTYILEQADDNEAILDILSSKLLDDEITARDTYPMERQEPFERASSTSPRPDHCVPPISEFLQIYNLRYTETLVRSCISEITSIIQLSRGRLVFYHASLTDFLRDRSRSSVFHVDLGVFATKVFPAVWKHGMIRVEGFGVPLAFKLLDLIQWSTPSITEALLTVHPSHVDRHGLKFSRNEFLENISRLYHVDDIKSYKQILKLWITRSGFVILDDFDDKNIPLLWRYLLIAKVKRKLRIVSRMFDLQPQ